MFETEKQRKWWFSNKSKQPIMQFGRNNSKPAEVPRTRERIEKFAPEIVSEVLERFPDKTPKKVRVKIEGLR